MVAVGARRCLLMERSDSVASRYEHLEACDLGWTLTMVVSLVGTSEAPQAPADQPEQVAH